MSNIDFANIAQTPDNALPINGGELIFGAPSRNSPPIVYHLPFTTSGTTNPVVTFYGLIAGRNNFTVTDGNVINISVVGDNVGIGTGSPDGVLTIGKNGQYTNNMISVWNTSNTSTQSATLNIGYGNGSFTVNGSLNVYNNASLASGTGIKNSTNLNSDGANGLSLSASNSNGYVSLYTAGKLPANEAVRIFPTGNMAIGYPGAYVDSGKKLDVNGNINIVNNAVINGNLAVGGTGAFTGQVTAFTPSLTATGNQVVTAAWVLSQGFAGGSLSETTANGLYVKQGGGVGQLGNMVYIGWSTPGRLKATVDITDQGNFAMEGVSNTFTPAQRFNGNITGTTATFTGTITGNLQGTAAKLGANGNIASPMTFNWSAVAYQPTYLWGGTDGTNMYVYNPLNFSVNYATTAGNGGVTSVNGLTGAVSIAIPAAGLGVGQTWKNVLGSRAAGTSYTNPSSTRSIYVSVIAEGGSGSDSAISMTCNGIDVSTCSLQNGYQFTVGAIIPPSGSYYIGLGGGAHITAWSELS